MTTLILMIAVLLVVCLWDVYAHHFLGPSATVTTVLVDFLYRHKLAQIGFYGWFIYITLKLVQRIVAGAVLRS